MKNSGAADDGGGVANGQSEEAAERELAGRQTAALNAQLLAALKASLDDVGGEYSPPGRGGRLSAGRLSADDGEETTSDEDDEDLSF